MPFCLHFVINPPTPFAQSKQDYVSVFLLVNCCCCSYSYCCYYYCYNYYYYYYYYYYYHHHHHYDYDHDHDSDSNCICLPGKVHSEGDITFSVPTMPFLNTCHGTRSPSLKSAPFAILAIKLPENCWLHRFTLVILPAMAWVIPKLPPLKY